MYSLEKRKINSVSLFENLTVNDVPVKEMRDSRYSRDSNIFCVLQDK